MRDGGWKTNKERKNRWWCSLFGSWSMSDWWGEWEDPPNRRDQLPKGKEIQDSNSIGLSSTSREETRAMERPLAATQRWIRRYLQIKKPPIQSLMMACRPANAHAFLLMHEVVQVSKPVWNSRYEDSVLSLHLQDWYEWNREGECRQDGYLPWVNRCLSESWTSWPVDSYQSLRRSKVH